MSPATIAGPGKRSRRGRTWVVAGVGLLVLALVVGGGWFWVNRDDAAPPIAAPRLMAEGERVSERVEQTGRATFELPDGGSVIVDAAVGVVTDSGARAPRGGRVVELAWRSFSRTSDPTWRGPRPGQVPVELGLSARGKSVAVAQVSRGIVGGDRNREPRQVVQVPGDGSSLKVTLSYAGRRQSMELFTGRREAGSFRGLYRPFTALRVDILNTLRDARTAGFTWNSYLNGWWFRTPHLPDRGWARPGREWIVISGAELVVQSAERDGVTWYPRHEPELTAGGVRVSGGRLDTGLPRVVTTQPWHRRVAMSVPQLVVEVRSGAPVQVELWFRPSMSPEVDAEPDPDAPGTGVNFARTLDIPGMVDLA